MSTEERAKAIAKNVEGKAQEVLGEITGDPEDKGKGKIKQAQAKAQHSVENVKEEAKKKLS